MVQNSTNYIRVRKWTEEGRMSDIRKLQDRYENDSTFRMMVDEMFAYIHQPQLSPSEIRDAAMYAVYKHQTMFPEPIGFTQDEINANETLNKILREKGLKWAHFIIE